MAYALVQANSADAGTGASPLTISYTNVPAQGNFLRVDVTNDTNSTQPTSVKDGNGNSFTLINGLARGTAQWTGQYGMIATASQSKAITVTLVGATLYLTNYELSGNFATIGSIIDNAQANNSTFAAGVNNSTSQPSVTSTDAGDLIMTTIGFSGATTAQTVTNTFTTLTKNTSASTKLYGAYRIPGATGTFNPSWAWTTSRTGIALTTAFLPAAGGTAYTSSLTGTLSFSGSFNMLTSRAFSATLSFVGAFAKLTSRALSATLNFSGAVSRFVGYGLSATLSFVGSLNRFITKTSFTASLSSSGAFVKIAGKSLAAGLSFSGSFSKQISKTLTASLSLSGTISRAIARKLTASLSFIGNFTGKKSGSVGTKSPFFIILTDGRTAMRLGNNLYMPL